MPQETVVQRKYIRIIQLHRAPYGVSYLLGPFISAPETQKRIASEWINLNQKDKGYRIILYVFSLHYTIKY